VILNNPADIGDLEACSLSLDVRERILSFLSLLPDFPIFYGITPFFSLPMPELTFKVSAMPFWS